MAPPASSASFPKKVESTTVEVALLDRAPPFPAELSINMLLTTLRLPAKLQIAPPSLLMPPVVWFSSNSLSATLAVPPSSIQIAPPPLAA
jgi:hypothetical protein